MTLQDAARAEQAEAERDRVIALLEISRGTVETLEAERDALRRRLEDAEGRIANALL